MQEYTLHRLSGRNYDLSLALRWKSAITTRFRVTPSKQTSTARIGMSGWCARFSTRRASRGLALLQSPVARELPVQVLVIRPMSAFGTYRGGQRQGGKRAAMQPPRRRQV